MIKPVIYDTRIHVMIYFEVFNTSKHKKVVVENILGNKKKYFTLYKCSNGFIKERIRVIRNHLLNRRIYKFFSTLNVYPYYKRYHVCI